ncbi:IS110 family transposase [Sinorhizobium medicae]|uniref:IS110 family transposase n=1 Tax=Sinorhizobium medicae TaxID=110321 RepID=UPI003B5282EC
MEACSSAHHWARELVTLGHDVRLIPPQYVKPYVKRNKTDAADAEAICEAATRPNMRFVPIKTRDQQAVLALHRSRSLLVRQRTASINTVRRLVGEFGRIAAKGRYRMSELRQRMNAMTPDHLPAIACQAIIPSSIISISLKNRSLMSNDKLSSGTRTTKIPAGWPLHPA